MPHKSQTYQLKQIKNQFIEEVNKKQIYIKDDSFIQLMKQIIDYRNARYQGELKEGRPHGLGIMIDYKNIFCLAEWQNGLIHGKCLVVFGDSKIFYGQIINKQPTGICTYHLKDKCQVFCNFTHPTSVPKPSQIQNASQPLTNNKLVALLPTFNMIIKVEGESQQQLEIKSEQAYRQNDFEALQDILQKMLDFKFKQGELDSFLSLQNFIRTNFALNSKYANALDIVLLSTQDGAKQIFLTLKTLPGHSSLGIRIQNCMENTTTMTNLHNDGNSYIVKSIGFFTKQGILQYGLKNIKTLIKGNVKEEAIYHNQKTILRYENQQSRPKQCSKNILNHFKRSSKYVNDYLQVRHLSHLQAECLNINFNIKETETKKYAQLILENPKELSMMERQTIEQARKRKLHSGSVQKNVKNDTSLTSSYQKQIEDSSKKNQQLEKVKEEIYRSVSKKKTNGGKSVSPYVHGGTYVSNSPQKDLKPAQLTNVKPILDIYKNTPNKSFYNSINGNDHTKDKNIQGYNFSIPKNVDPTHENKSVLSKNVSSSNLKDQGSLGSTDYFKNLESRRRLYEQVYPPSREQVRSPKDALKRPSVMDDSYSKKTPQKKKVSYLPEDDPDYRQDHSRYRKNVSNPNFNYLEMSRQHPITHYNPSAQRIPYRDISSNHPNQQFFRSQRLSPHQRSRTPERNLNDNQVGKLGRRTNYNRQEKSQRSIIDALDYPQYRQSPYDDPYNKKSHSSFDPIVVPQLKINQNHIKRPVQEQDYMNVNPRRQHNLRTRTNNVPPNHLGYRETGDGHGYYVPKQEPYRSVSPLQKRKRILHENPFDS